MYVCFGDNLFGFTVIFISHKVRFPRIILTGNLPKKFHIGNAPSTDYVIFFLENVGCVATVLNPHFQNSQKTITLLLEQQLN